MNIFPSTRPPPQDALAWPLPPGGWPLISIITPSLNRASYIRDAIDSVRGQNYPSLEHLVIDGGSSDDTAAILAEYDHLRVVQERDLSSHHAMNKGLRLARGAIVGFLNTDDVYAPGILRAVAAHAADRQHAVISGRCFFTSADPGTPLMAEAELRHVSDPQLYLDELCYATPGFNSYFFTRAVLDALDGFDERFDVAADRDLLIRAAIAGYHTQFLDAPAYYYRRHAGSRTLDAGARLAEKILTDHIAIAAKLLSSPAPEAIRSRLREWQAWETARLVQRTALRDSGWTALVIAIRALAEHPAWPLLAAVAQTAVGRLARHYRSAG